MGSRVGGIRYLRQSWSRRYQKVATRTQRSYGAVLSGDAVVMTKLDRLTRLLSDARDLATDLICKRAREGMTVACTQASCESDGG